MEAFAALGAGIKFDRKRFKEDIRIFQSTKRTKASVSSPLNRTNASPDFFSVASAAQLGRDVLANDKSSAVVTTTTNTNIGGGEEECKDFENEELIGRFRNEHKIKVYAASGNESVPAPVKSFQHLATKYQLPTAILRQISASGYSQPTPIQMQAIPILLSCRDLIACAPTGSGKTMAFILPLLLQLYSSKGSSSGKNDDDITTEKKGIKSIIISPTRELAQQIHRECLRLAPKQIKSAILSKSNVAHPDKRYDILISTPMRLVSAIKQEQIQLDHVKFVVVDEADKLFELGFIEQIDEIMAALQQQGQQCQKCLFSATIDSHVEALAKTVMRDPVRIVIGQKNSAADTVDQELVFVGQEEGKMLAIRQLIQAGFKPPVLIFVESIGRAKEVFQEISVDTNIKVDVIHSERSVAQRDQIIKSFRSGKIWVLISTELLGRGLDFKGVNLVINYDFPRSVASYIHRIGRTGRAGRRGRAITYFTKEDAPYLRSVATLMQNSGCEVADWMLSLPKAKKNRRRNRKPAKEEEEQK